MTYDKYTDFIRHPYFAVCSNGDGELVDSKFSGIPWLKNDESWPKCGNCDKAMQLLLQVNLVSMPKDVGDFGTGLIQVFYCTTEEPDCEVDCESWCWNDKAMLVRLVQPIGTTGSPTVSPVVNAFSPKLIRRWEEGQPELPRVEELNDYFEMTNDERDVLYDEEASEAYPGPAAGDKLGGWPDWVQGVEYPECRKCAKSMKLVFQIDSHVNLPYMWGDSGCAHITQCPEHTDVLSLGWACL